MKCKLNASTYWNNIGAGRFQKAVAQKCGLATRVSAPLVIL